MKAFKNSSFSLEFKITGKSLYSLDLPVSPGWEAFPEPSVEVAPKRQRIEGCRCLLSHHRNISLFLPCFPFLCSIPPHLQSNLSFRTLPAPTSGFSVVRGKARSSLSWSK